jgi:hypothetical protein
MLVLSLPSSDSGIPRHPQRRRRGGIVWQPHYEGFTTVAYQSGKAMAGISGPWSGQYVLIWWEQTQPIREVELFDSLEEAKQAVAQRIAPDAGNQLQCLLGVLRGVSAKPRPSWLSRLRRWMFTYSPSAERRGQTRLVDHRRRRDNEQTDLRGLNLRAVR